MSFATIIAVLAMGVALVALWLVSDVIKKVESQNEKFVQAHISSIRDEIRSTDRALAKAVKAVKVLTEGTDVTDKRINAHTTDFDNVRSRIAKIADELEQLDRSIPQRYRARVATPKEGDKKADSKAKPTVQ